MADLGGFDLQREVSVHTQYFDENGRNRYQSLHEGLEHILQACRSKINMLPIILGLADATYQTPVSALSALGIENPEVARFYKFGMPPVTPQYRESQKKA